MDAKLDINGTVLCNGYLYSTVEYVDVQDEEGNWILEDFTVTGGGANICSSEGTGVLHMVNGAGADLLGMMYDQGASTEGIFYNIPIASAQLRNGDGTMLDTTGAEAGTVYEYCTTHDCWYTAVCYECDPCYYDGHTEGPAADCVHDQTCTVCGEVLEAATGVHTYDDDYDVNCNVCGAIRVVSYDVITFNNGNSVAETSDGKIGLAFKFDVTDRVTGLALKAGTKYVADYTGAAVTPDSTGTYTLVMMGAVVSNNNENPTLNELDATTSKVIDIQALKLFELDEENTSYVIRIVNIPAAKGDASIWARPYFIYEKGDEQIVVYGDTQVATYNQYAPTVTE